MSTPFFGSPDDLKTRKVAVFDLHPDRVQVRVWPKTENALEFDVQLTQRRLAAFRASVRHLVRYDRPFPYDMRSAVVDVPAPSHLPDPAVIADCSRLVASLDPYGFILLSLLERASIGCKFSMHGGRGWYVLYGLAMPDAPHSSLANGGREQIRSRIGAARADELGVVRVPTVYKTYRRVV